MGRRTGLGVGTGRGGHPLQVPAVLSCRAAHPSLLSSSPSCQVLLYLARGHYDSDDLRSAKQYLLRAIHIAPTDYKLRFNAALTMQVGGGTEGGEGRDEGGGIFQGRASRVFPPLCRPHTFAPHSVSQEWAVRVYRKVRPANDPTRVVEYRQAQEDLRQALK